MRAAQHRRDPVGRGPAHQAGEGPRVDGRADLPDARIGRARHGDGLPRQAGEQGQGGRRLLVLEALVQEHGGEGECGLPEDVVLALQGRTVSHPDRPVAAEARPARDETLVQVGSPIDAVERGQVQVGASSRHVEQPLDEPLPLLELPQQLEGSEDVVGVPEPAVPIVPVPPAPRRLGDRRRGGGHDRARVLEAVELQCQGRADDRVLEEDRHRAALHPASPIANGLPQEAVGERLERLLDGLPPGQRQVAPPGQ